jgi:2-polyprenyl-3-methyl-5-hydroxy-6-metoxy-1,4-benzoquinol methylase
MIKYALSVTSMADHIASRDRLHKAYTRHHVGRDESVDAALTYRRDIRPALPRPSAGPVVDIGCGQGELVRLLLWMATTLGASMRTLSK